MHGTKGISFDAPRAETRLVMLHQENRSDEIHTGVSWTEGLGKYKLTKVITLAPRFIVKNNFSQSLAIREHGVAPRGRAAMEPGERRPLNFLRVGVDKLMTVALPGLNAQWYVVFMKFTALMFLTYESGLLRSTWRTSA